jgi:hypothetical protein
MLKLSTDIEHPGSAAVLICCYTYPTRKVGVDQYFLPSYLKFILLASR